MRKRHFSAELQLNFCVTVSAGNADDAQDQIAQWADVAFGGYGALRHNKHCSNLIAEQLGNSISYPEQLRHKPAFKKMSTAENQIERMNQ